MKLKRLFWDIETSYDVVASWRIGYKVSLNHDNILRERAIICICWKWEDKKKVHSLTWDDGCDKEMLRKFREVALEADELVAHNGDKFDRKWLNTRMIMNGLDPLPKFKTIDTLVIAKSNFYFNNNRLDYLGKLLAGGGKDDMCFNDWLQICEHNHKPSLRKMVKYCKGDVEVLEQVYKKLEPYHTPKTHVGVLGHRDKWSCPWTGSTNVSKKKTRVTAKGTVQHQMFSNEHKGYYTISNKAFEDYKEWKKKLA